MKRRLQTTGAFARDVKRARKRGRDIDKLWRIVGLLTEGAVLPARHRAHRLVGAWAPFWECHIEPDWLLVWHDNDEALILVRTGTHADLFG